MIVFLDMDGVLADFDGAIPPGSGEDPPEMFVPGFFRNLKVMPGAAAAVGALMADPRYEVYIGSKPTTKATTCATEKYEWVGEHFPKLLRRIVLVCDKRLLRGDFLVDDDKKWMTFEGEFIYFDRTNPRREWVNVLQVLGVR